MEENNSIYKLKLNEVMLIEDSTMGCNTYIRRIPDGWIYTSVFYNTESTNPTSCFVPYNPELATREEIAWQRDMKKKLRPVRASVVLP